MNVTYTESTETVICHRCKEQVPMRVAGGFRLKGVVEEYIWTCQACLDKAGGIENVVRQTKIAMIVLTDK